MVRQSLLRRLRQPELASPRRVTGDEEVRAAVLDHLRAMFLTRVGSALASPEYGMISVTDIVHSCPDAINDVVRSIQQSIRRFEPRLANVVVKHVGREATDGTIRFEITGEVVDGARRTSVKFETTINASRDVHVA
ncbi:MAG TPA: type VI secretion system baseplate subunit TssE [Labilithrix sp.]|jgi:type VI secretion system protein|nr:type VI secretion system baseplate subunit TssE [Labilithrix sp.]